MSREFRYLTVDEAMQDLESVLKLGEWKAYFAEYGNKQVNELPFRELSELAGIVVDFMVDTYILKMDSLSEDDLDYYRRDFSNNGVPWLDYRKNLPYHPLLLKFASHHIEELSLTYAMYDTYLIYNEDDPDLFKTYTYTGKGKKIGPIKIKGKTIESTFLDDLKLQVHLLVYEYYCYGKHPYDDDNTWKHLLADTADTVRKAIDKGEQEGGVILI